MMVKDVELSKNTGYTGDQGTNSGKPVGIFWMENENKVWISKQLVTLARLCRMR